MVIKNKEYEIYINKLGDKGEGIGTVNNFPIFVENVLLEEVVVVKILKIKKTHAYGKLISIQKESKERVIPKCKTYSYCGGCTTQHMSYTEQLKFKTNKVISELKRSTDISNTEIRTTIGMDNPLYYRNKGQFPIKNINNEPCIGFYRARSHDLIPIEECIIQHESHKEILSTIKDYINTKNITSYDEVTNKGLLRHILIRVALSTNEIMICFVINGDTLPHKEYLISNLSTIKNIKSILLNINKNKANTILGNKIKVLKGGNFITDIINNIKYKISINSFYQINPVQTKVLYDTVIKFGKFEKSDLVIDAYCGIGTISLYIAEHVKKVIGIEIIDTAIQDANENSKLNNIKNTEFLTGASEEIIPKIISQGFDANTIILNPPRKGCDMKLIDTIIKNKLSKIIYVSCNPTTLARDVKILCNNGYKLLKVQPVDCFPMTWHVETIVLLQRR